MTDRVSSVVDEDLKVVAERLIDEAIGTLELSGVIQSGIIDRPIILQPSKTQGSWYTSSLIRSAREHLDKLGLPEKEIRSQSRTLSERWALQIISYLNQQQLQQLQQSQSSSTSSSSLLPNSFEFKSCLIGVINIFLVNADSTVDMSTSGDDPTTTVSSSSTIPSTASSSSQQLSTFPATIIGTIHSCFRSKYAAPRQGSFVPSSRGVATLDRRLSPEFLDGLSDFSHCWLIWIFHQASTPTSHSDQLKPKIRPPKLGGARTGIFATRSPHRPFPVGLSVVKIESVKGRQVFISGLDLVDGTPLLDIKPYHPLDVVPMHQLKYPNWVSDGQSSSNGNDCRGLNRVIIKDEIKQQLTNRFDQLKETKKSQFGGVGCFKFFDSVELFLEAMSESLRLDPRTIQQQRDGEENRKKDYDVFFLDSFDVFYTVDDDARTATILRIEPKRFQTNGSTIATDT